MEEFLIVKNVNKLVRNKGLEKKQILTNVNFSVKRGEIVCLLGANGSGKTTIMKLIVGLLNISSGDILLNNTNIKKFKNKYLENVGLMIESPYLYDDLSGMETLKMFSRMYSKNITNEMIYDAINFMDISEFLYQRVGTYSLGMKQKLGIAIALINNPELLILDEPINGLDPKSTLIFRENLKKLRDEKNTAILISSHSLEEVESIADKVIIFKDGKIKNIFDLSVFTGDLKSELLKIY